jgi:hypothetical protein
LKPDHLGIDFYFLIGGWVGRKPSLSRGANCRLLSAVVISVTRANASPSRYLGANAIAERETHGDRNNHQQ